MCSILLGLIMLVVAGFLLVRLLPYLLMGAVVLFAVLFVIYGLLKERR